MTDLVKGVIIGVIAVKVIESDTVKNYIHKVIRKKAKDFGEKVADAVFPVKEEEPEEKVVKRDENGKPIAGRYRYVDYIKDYPQFIILYDSQGNPHRVRKEAVK